MGYFLVASLAPLTLLVFNTDWFFTRREVSRPLALRGILSGIRQSRLFAWRIQARKAALDSGGLCGEPVLPTAAAAYVLHAAFFVLMCGAMFWALYSLLGRRGARDGRNAAHGLLYPRPWLRRLGLPQHRSRRVLLSRLRDDRPRRRSRRDSVPGRVSSWREPSTARRPRQHHADQFPADPRVHPLPCCRAPVAPRPAGVAWRAWMVDGSGAVAVTALLADHQRRYSDANRYSSRFWSASPRDTWRSRNQSVVVTPLELLWVLKAHHLSFPFAVALAGAIVAIRLATQAAAA